MAQVITFAGFTPAPRYDSIPWTEVRIQESGAAYTTAAEAEAGVWTVIDTIALSPLDADPAAPDIREFTTELASDTADLWYRIIFLDATGDDTLPTLPIQNIVTAATIAADPYATVSELQRILKIRTPTSLQTAEMQRVLSAAAGEINSEIGRVNSALSGWEVALAAEVNLERAVEHWQQQDSPFGLLGIGAIAGPTHTATDSWNRHANKLAPLKNSWGLA